MRYGFCDHHTAAWKTLKLVHFAVPVLSPVRRMVRTVERLARLFASFRRHRRKQRSPKLQTCFFFQPGYTNFHTYIVPRSQTCDLSPHGPSCHSIFIDYWYQECASYKIQLESCKKLQFDINFFSVHLCMRKANNIFVFVQIIWTGRNTKHTFVDS